MYGCWITCCLLLPSLALGKNVRVFIMAGQSNMEGYARVGSLRELVDNPVSNHPWDDFSHLVNADGSWKTRSDVTLAFKGIISKLTVGKGTDGAKFGPELGFGYVVGDYFTEPVLIIKYAVGGTSLAVDWRPDSSGIPVVPLSCKRGPCTALDYGKVYREMLAFVATVLNNLNTMVPEYAGFKPILSGFIWFHGYNGEQWNIFCIS
jgi:Carbohydrate esterase, sialic acid-specific acetylesterase